MVTFIRVALASVLCGVAWPAQSQPPTNPPGTLRIPTVVWAPKPTSTPGYTGIQRPWVKLADLKAKHKGKAHWREVVVDDGRLTGEYVLAAPGTTVGPQLHPDTREWFAVVEGEVRVRIEGQAPLVATRGSLVNIPRQTITRSKRWATNRVCAGS